MNEKFNINVNLIVIFIVLKKLKKKKKINEVYVKILYVV